MRALLIMFAATAVQAGLYYWFLPDQEIYWESLIGLALVALTIACWSAALQILWSNQETPPDSPDAEPPSPTGFMRQRTRIAAFMVLLACLPLTGLAIWGFRHGAQVYRVGVNHVELDQDRLMRTDPGLVEQVPPIMERRFQVSLQEYNRRNQP